MCLCQISEASAYPGLRIIKNHLAVKPGGKTPAQPQKAYVIIVKRALCADERGNYIHKETPPSCASQYPCLSRRVRLEVPAPVTVILAETVQMKDFKVSLSWTLYITTQHKMNFPHLITTNCNFFFFNQRWGLWSSSEPGGNGSLRFSDNSRGEETKFRDRCWLLSGGTIPTQQGVEA